MTKQEWIKIKDKLPPNNSRLIVYTTTKEVVEYVQYFEYGSGDKLFLVHGNRTVDLEDNIITHWMLAPELPKPPLEK